MPIQKFIYQYLDGIKQSCNQTVLLDPANTNYLGQRTIDDNGTPVSMYVVTANGHSYGSTTMTLQPDACCDVAPSQGNVAYVQKQYTGPGAAIITGKTVANITSTNADYTKQLGGAIINSEANPFPDPWSARNALLDAIAAGKIASGYIVVKGGEQFTVGSDVATNNGDGNGVVANATVADVGFSSTNSTFIASLLQDKIAVHFEDNTLIKYINKSYTIYLAFNDTTGANTFRSSITGYLTLEYVYGSLQGFEARCYQVNNAYANVYFQIKTAYFQNGTPFYLHQSKTVIIDINDVIWAGGRFFQFFWYTQARDNGDGSVQTMDVHIKSLVKTNSYKYPASQIDPYIWKFNTWDQQRYKHFNFKIDNLYIEAVRFVITDSDWNAIPSTRNMLFSAQVENMVAVQTAADSRNDIGGIMGQNQCKNTQIQYHFKNVLTDFSIIGFQSYFCDGLGDTSDNNRFMLRCDKAFKRSPFNASGIIQLNGGNGSPTNDNRFIVEGNYSCDAGCGKVIDAIADTFRRWLFTGTYTVRGNKPVIVISNNQVKLTLKDTLLINDSTVTVTTGVAGSKLLLKDAVATAALDANTTTAGDALRVNALLKDYL